MRMVRVDKPGKICELQYTFRFKLFLEPKALRDESTVDPRLPRLPVSATIPQLFHARRVILGPV